MKITLHATIKLFFVATVLLEHSRSSDTVRRSDRKYGGREVLSLYETDRHADGSIRQFSHNSYTRDAYFNIDIYIAYIHGHTMPILT